MIWIRSYPSERNWVDNELENVPHVVDRLPKLMVSNYDYASVRDHNSLQTPDGWPETNFCMLEWDIALDPVEQRIFWAEAMIEPRQVLVAPYRFHDTWICWIGNDGSAPSEDSRPITYGEDKADNFGLGCIYIPRVILDEFLPQMDKFGFTDATFGKWYRERYGQVRVTWNVHPQHIHDYEIT